LADVGPVFLFDVGVVVFVVGAGAGEVDGLFSLGEVTDGRKLTTGKTIVQGTDQNCEKHGGWIELPK
jgi:hypothetical protein